MLRNLREGCGESSVTGKRRRNWLSIEHRVRVMVVSIVKLKEE